MKKIAMLTAALTLAATAGAAFAGEDRQSTTVVTKVPGTPVATGKVVGPTDEPQAGVPVQVQGPVGKSYAFTDKDGVWTLYNLPAGDYMVVPVGSLAVNGSKVASFTVRERGLWTFTSNSATTYYAPDMPISKEVNQ